MGTSRTLHVLIVDDDPLIHQSFRLLLPTHWRPVSAMKITEIPDSRSFHAAFVDLHLSPPTPDGLKALELLKQRQARCELVAMSGEVRRDLMEAALKNGAQRFLAKPLHVEEVQLVLQKIEALWELQAARATGDGARWIGSGPASQRILQQLAALRGETSPILIEGESGCGKEVVARLLHEQEPDTRPWIAVNVGAIPENLFEAEMFGSVKGAFTGADRDRVGLCEAADGGDLFLDEIEALPLAQQAKLLRFLESGELRRVGAKETLKVRCRVIAATNRPLQDLVEQGLFREDLMYRLGARRLPLPPLRERLEDLPELARHFLASERPRRNKEFTEDGLAKLALHGWPGNVRELKRVCEQLSLMAPLPLIRAEDVDPLLRPSSRDSGRLDLKKGLAALVEDFERRVLTQTLKEAHDVEAAAQLLGISRSNLYKKIKDLNLETT
jgi:DNA-binding NtrC family response regulator